MCAKLCEADEKLLFYKRLTDRLQEGSAMPSLNQESVDADLARELSEKDLKIQQLERQLQEKDDSLIALNEDYKRLKVDSENMNSLIIALHAQVSMFLWKLTVHEFNLI